MSAEDIEQGIPLVGFQTTVSRATDIVGVQGTNQPGVFLDDDPQDEIRGCGHTPPFKPAPAARHRLMMELPGKTT